MIVDGLLTSPLMAELKTPLLEQIAAACHTRDFGEGDVLCHQNDVAHSLWLVLDGWVKLTRETLDGGDAVWDVLGVGHLVGLETLTAPFTNTTRAVAVSDMTALVVPHSTLRQLVDSNGEFARLILKHVLRQQQDERLEIEHRTHQTAPQRIGCFLLKLAGTPAKGKVDIQLPFDKGLLAARLGMQPETFSRALAKLKQETGLRMTGAHVVMDDVDALRAYTCGACSGSYPCHGHA